MANNRTNYYEILEVDEAASNNEIRTAYRTLVKKYHPDIYQGTDKNEAEEILKCINEAYNCLSDAKKRKKYDKGLQINTKSINTSRKVNNSNNYNDSSYTENNNSNVKKSTYESMNFHELNYYCHGQKKTYDYVPDKDKVLKERISLMVKVVAIVLVVTVIILGGIFIDRFTRNNQEKESLIAQESYNNGAAESNQVRDSRKKYTITIPVITLGDRKDKVRATLGQPTTIRKDKWRYGSSIIFFDWKNEVIGWDNPDDKLDLYIGDADKDASPIKKNSTKKEVIRAMGTPTYLTKEKWRYGVSAIYFNSGGEVKFWDNAGHNLKVKPTGKKY